MDFKLLSDQRGKGVVELLIVVVIIGIVTTMALMGLGRSRDAFTRQNIARELKVNMERARFDAIKRRVAGTSEMAQIVFLSETSYRIRYDLNWNGSLDTVDERVVNFASRGGIKILGTNMTYPTTVSFDENGNASVLNAQGQKITALFTICDQGCTGTATASNTSYISISPTGTVDMYAPGASRPAFTTPTTTLVNSNTQINPLIRVVR